LQLVWAIRHVRRRSHLGWFVSLVTLCACLVFRIYIQRYGDFLGSCAFIPAVMTAALFGGAAEAVSVFFVSAFILFFFYVPPYLTFQINRPTDTVGLFLFLLVGSVSIYLITSLNRAIDISDKLASDRLAIESRTAVLFAELQHRVANNLSFLVSVLNRQIERNVSGPVALQSIKDRLIALGRSHRRLYDPAKVDKPIGPYFGELCSEQIAVSGLPVTHAVACDQIVLELDQVVSVALIVSELVNNSLKHAFKDRSHGHIEIGFHQSSELSEYVLTVSDNGCGFNVSSDSVGLGKMIIRGLAAQLKAQVSYENNNGTTVTVRIPKRELAARPI